MPTRTHPSAPSADATSAITSYDERDPDSSMADPCALPPVVHGEESLATSTDASRLLLELDKVLHCVMGNATVPSSPESQFCTDRFFTRFDANCFQRAVAQEPHLPKSQLLAKLSAAFQAEVLEDGVTHPAEGTIGKAVQSAQSERVLQWLREFCLDAKRPSFGASILRCLGRLESPGTASWREELVRAALAMENVEIRDAAVQAVELWGDGQTAMILIAHRDPVPWLHKYLQDVIEELAS